MRYRFRDKPGTMVRIRDDNENPTEKRFKAIEDALKGICDRMDAKDKARDEEPDEDGYDAQVEPGEEASKVAARQENSRTSDAARRMNLFIAASARRWGRRQPTADSGPSKMDRFLAASKLRREKRR